MELEQAVEHLEHAAHGEVSRLRTVVSLLIVTITAAGACVGYAAVRANTHAEEAGRARQLAVVQSQQEQSRVNAINESATLTQIDASDAGTRSLGYYLAAGADPGGPQAQALLDAGDRLSKRQDALTKGDPTQDETYLPKQSRGYTEADQKAIVLGERTEGWVHKEDVYVGSIGIFAVCLFLLGLALTMASAKLRVGFIALACVLATFGVGRAAVTERAPQAELPEAALTAYLDGFEHAQTNKRDVAIKDLEKAVHIDHHYSDAWKGLGDELVSPLPDGTGASDKDLASGAEAYREAIKTGNTDVMVRNNLAYTELILGDVAGAARDIRLAAKLAPEEPVIVGTQAEIALGQHKLAEANRLNGEMEDLVVHLDGEYRNNFLSGQVGDGDLLARHHVGTDAERKTFIDNLVDAQASIDAFGSREPRDLHGATVDGLKLTYDQDGLRMKYSLVEHGHAAGDVVSVRVLAADGSYSPDTSDPAVIPTGGSEITVKGETPMYEGTYHVQVFLNGHLQVEDDIKAAYKQ